MKDRREVWLVGLLNVYALGAAALHLYVRTLPATPTPLPGPGDPESRWWGLWPATYPPGWLVWLGAGVVLAAVIWGQRHVRRPVASSETPPHLPFWLLGAAALALFGSFFLFPIVHTRWGDAYLLSRALAWPDPELRLTHSWQAPLDVFLHSQVWLHFHQVLGWGADAAPVYRLLSPLAGGLYLLAVLGLAQEDAQTPNWLTFGLLSSLGVIQLFYGYVENYSFAAAGILGYLWLGLRTLRGKAPLWLAALILAVTNGLHPSTVVYAPSLLYLGWRAWRRPSAHGAEGQPAWRIALTVVGPMFLVAGGVILLMETGGHGLGALLTDDRPGGGDGRWLVPLFTTSTRWEHYTMFSWPHLRDFLNEQMLVAPGASPALLITALFMGMAWLVGDKQKQALLGKDTETRFLLWAAGCHLLLTWVWNPDYGGQRDWDLFSLAAIPTALLLARTLPRVLSRRALTPATLPLLLLQALHAAAWIYQNRLPWNWP
ncbi:MAG: hypothetical protein D6790_16830 [Caldilineae bacterium]|nr:MAG: hypothetical protein D6790_16830 [Caldilineae bacterium]